MANNPNPFAGGGGGGDFSRIIRQIFGGNPQRLSGTRAETPGNGNPFQNLAAAAMNGLGGVGGGGTPSAPANPFDSSGSGAVHNPYGTGGGGGGGMPGAPGGGLPGSGMPGAPGGGFSGTPGGSGGSGNPYSMYYMPDITYFTGGGSWDQLWSQQMGEYLTSMHADPGGAGQRINPHAWGQLIDARGYPPGSAGQKAKNGEWITPDGRGPDWGDGTATFAHFTSSGSGVMPGYESSFGHTQPDGYIMDTFGGQMTAIANDDAAIAQVLADPAAAIWRHLTYDQFVRIVNDIRNGGSGDAGGMGSGQAYGGGATLDDVFGGGGGGGGTGGNGKGPGAVDQGTTKRPGGGGGGGGKQNASGGKKGDHKNTGPGGGRDNRKRR